MTPLPALAPVQDQSVGGFGGEAGVLVREGGGGEEGGEDDGEEGGIHGWRAFVSSYSLPSNTLILPTH